MKPPDAATAPFRFSVVVPTYNRRDLVVRTVLALGETARPWPCELVVVVDGSTDGTAEALRALPLDLPIRVIEQENRGAASARNRGAAEARGEILLFLDDDMIVEPDILVEQARVFESETADAVVGHIPAHPETPVNLLTTGLRRWAEDRRDRLVRSGGRLTLGDLLTGQLAVRAEVFAALGGFDENFTDGGTFGGEDTDFLYRLLLSGARAQFAPDAVSYQMYRVTPRSYLRQWRQAGHADARLSRKHVGLGDLLAAEHAVDALRGRVTRALASVADLVPEPVKEAIRRPLVERVEAGHTDRQTAAAFTYLRDTCYWSGARAGGGLVRRLAEAPRILAYHAVEDVADPRIGDYCVPPAQLEAQLGALLDRGFSFIGADELLDYLDGGPLKGPSLVLTFDDAYRSVLEHAAPLLRRLGIPATIFAVTAEIGGTNSWDAGDGAVSLPLLDAEGLRALHADGWEVGAHSRRHAHLPQLDAAGLRDELVTPRAELAAAGLPSPRLFAYPYGEHDWRVRAEARAAGYAAAFGLREPRRLPRPGSRYALPRVEVLRRHSPDDLVEAVLGPALADPRSVARREGLALAGTVSRATGRPAAVGFRAAP